MEILTKVEYRFSLSDEEFNLMAACVAQCAGVKTRVDAATAKALNEKLVELEVKHFKQRLEIAERKLAKTYATSQEQDD